VLAFSFHVYMLQSDICFHSSFSHLATKRGRQYATLSFVVICCNDLMAGAALMATKRSCAQCNDW